MLKLLVDFILIILYCVNGNCDTNLLSSDNNEAEMDQFNEVTNCIVAICGSELFFRPTVAIMQQDINNTRENAYINELIYKLMEYNIPQVLVKDIFEEKNHELHIHALTIAFFSACGDIINFDFSKIDRDMRFLIIISDPSNNDYCTEQLKEVAELVSRYAVTFIIQDFETGKNNMYTIFPVIDGKTCKEVVDAPTHINTCSNGTIENEEIFPVKNPSNLNKCPLKIGMATSFPFSTIPNSESLKMLDPVKEIKGSDYEIMKIVAKYFNATLDIYYLSRKQENRQGGFINLLINGTFEACAGGIYRVYGDIVEYSGIYVRQGIFWIYPVKRAERSWENLMIKLHNVYMFIIFYITYSIVWCLISMFDEDSVSLVSTFLYSWGALVGAASLQHARSNKQKLLNLLYLIMCIYSSAYISIQFYSFLTIRGPPQLFKTNSEVMASGRPAFLRNSSKSYPKDEKYNRFAEKAGDCTEFLDCAEKVFKHNGLTTILQGNFYGFQAETAVNDEATIIRTAENLLTVFNEMLIRKNSSLVARFQRVNKRLFEAGIHRRLFDEAVGISVVTKAHIVYTNIITSSYSCQSGCSITLSQVAGIFYAWILGCVISFLAFLAEVFRTQDKTPTVREFVN